MTPEINEKYAVLKMITDSMTGLLICFDDKVFEEWEKAARPYANGTMGIIACQVMSMREVQTTEKNLTNAIKISAALRNLKQLLIESGSSHE